MADNRLIHVPPALLCDPSLPPTAKLVWMVDRLRQPGTPLQIKWLAATAGLSRNTVSEALTALTAAGWPAGAPSSPPSGVPVPASLLTNTRLGTLTRILYPLLLLTPGYHHPSGRFTSADLSSLIGRSRQQNVLALDELIRAEWIKLTQEHRLAAYRFELTEPGREARLNAQAAVEERLDKAPHFGEGLMREYLNLLIPTDQYDDWAKPGFLINPSTGAPLELDRFYPPSVGFEFQGPQHERPTRRYTAAKVTKQRTRDLIKLGLCLEKGVTLVTVWPEHLTLEGMRAKVGNLLPTRTDLNEFELVIEHLEKRGRPYREWTATL